MPLLLRPGIAPAVDGDRGGGARSAAAGHGGIVGFFFREIDTF